jgi:L-ribulose-5-phosphate 3-epimerase UlaE
MLSNSISPHQYSTLYLFVLYYFSIRFLEDFYLLVCILEFLRLKDRYANLHVHDNLGKVDQHLVIGEGNIDFRALLNGLKDYKGPFIIESMNLEEGVESKGILEEMLG